MVTQDQKTGRWDHEWIVINARANGRSYRLKEVGSSLESIRNRNKIRPQEDDIAK